MKKNKLIKIIKSICAVVGVAASGLLIWTKFSEKKHKKDEDLSKDIYAGAGVPVHTVKKSFYEKYMKRFIDIVISIMGIIVLSPVFVVTAAAIFITDPGPVIFTQKRVGINKTFFKLYKFRSMKMSTPHDVPTHMLDNPESYITTVGKFIRKTSIDELPQLFNILEGNLSVIGPRPALWNQKDLVAERDKYCANDVMPGLTGWAQINGRDELEIPVKAKLDGEYVERLRKNNFSGFMMDVKCFFGTITSVLKSDGVVEGGTGEMKKNARYDIPDVNTRIGFGEEVSVDLSQKKKVLITGANSYIGESFEKYAKEHYVANFEIDTVDMIDGSWREKDFSEYDTVFHVAGIAHADVGKVSEEVKDKYYAVNTDLAIETAEKAKKEGVKQFVFMSSMIVYGESAPYGKQKMITADTEPEPANFYGDSKWQADKGVRVLADEDFNVLVLRPPMIYGKGSKGNYPILAKLAKKLPVFPDVNNHRSMLYIENLCEFLCQVMLIGKGGIFFPQNTEYTRTAEMVKEISNAAGKKICLSKLFNPAVLLVSKTPGKIGGLMNKAFGNSCYDLQISIYPGLDYQIFDMKNSVFNTEEISTDNENRKMLMLASVASMIDQFNMGNISILQRQGYQIDVACNFKSGSSCSNERVNELIKILESQGIRCYQIDFSRNVMNIKSDLYAYKQVKKLLIENKYSFVHCHSPIGGVIGRLAGHKAKTKIIYTAHGFHFFKGAPLKNWLIYYPIEKMLSKWTDVLITINKEDYELANKKFNSKSLVQIPGVGINHDSFSLCNNKEEIRKKYNIPDDAFVVFSVVREKDLPQVENLNKLIKNINESICFVVARKELNNSDINNVQKYKKSEILWLSEVDGTHFDMADLYVAINQNIESDICCLEAMAAGLPIIEGLENNVTEQYQIMLGKEIKKMYSDVEYRNILGLNNLLKIRKFNIKTCTNDIDILIEKKYSHLTDICLRQNMRREMGIRLDDFVILSVGEVNENKNHRVIMEAIAKTGKKDIKYVVVGKGDLIEEHEKFADSKKISEQCFFVGFQTDVRSYLLMSDVFAFPSKREGLGLSAIEAMACGLPLLTSNIHGINDYSINGETGYKCESSDSDAFAEAILKLYQNRCMSLDMGKSNIDKSRRFDIRYVEGTMKKVYEMVR